MGKPPDDIEPTKRVPLRELRGEVGADAERRGGVLTCLTQPKMGLVYRLTAARTVIGRAEECDLQLSGPGVSREHAAITGHEGTYTLEDLGSTNGTYCRGQKLTEPLALKDRDTIRLGASVLLRFSFDDALEEQMGTELYERATRDPLTGARNRRYFNDRLDSEWPWARRHDRSCALLMLDLDHFKRVNDEWGHPAGDHVLREFVRLVDAELRQEDLFGRIGGEEFAVLCRSTAVENATTLAERLRCRVETHPFLWKGERLPVTVSIGIATSLEPEVSNGEQLLQRADERMYAAKRQGRNLVVAELPERLDGPTQRDIKPDSEGSG
jgi:two-component system cell cycle response regulator